MLAERGSFEKIGKRSVWSLPLANAAATSAQYDLLAVDVDMSAQSDWMQGVLRLLASRAGRDVVHGMPLVTFDFARALQAAFRLLQKGQNVGKVVVRIVAHASST